LVKNNNQSQEPGGEDLEALLAQKDTELAAKDLRISELEQTVASRDNQIAALRESLAEVERRLSQAVSAYRALVIKSNPAVPEELITGESIEAIDKAVADAGSLISRVRQELEAELAGARVPAGAPQRRGIDLSALSPQEKIKYAIGERR